MDAKKNNQQNQDNFTVETGIGPTTDRILNIILDRLTTDKFREKLIEKIVDPVTDIINEKIRPYVYVSIGLYSIIIILLVFIIYILLVKKKKLT